MVIDGIGAHIGDNILNIPNLHKPSLQEKDENINNLIYRKENYIPSDICDEVIKYAEENGYIRDIRNFPYTNQHNTFTCLLPLNNNLHNALEPLWQEMINFFNFDITFIEPYEVKKYVKTSRFGSHTDMYSGLNNKLDRKLTISIQLSDRDEYVGGDLSVNHFHVNGANKPRAFHKEVLSGNKGTVFAFPSFLPHEVSMVLSGVRWVVIGWAWGPYWR